MGRLPPLIMQPRERHPLRMPGCTSDQVARLLPLRVGSRRGRSKPEPEDDRHLQVLHWRFSAPTEPEPFQVLSS